jgi:hypothetical protein
MTNGARSKRRRTGTTRPMARPQWIRRLFAFPMRAAGPGDASLRWALLLVSRGNVGSVLHYFAGARSLRAGLARVAAT